MWSVELPLRGPSGEPIDLERTFLSHGVASLPPMTIADDGSLFEATLALQKSRPRSVRVERSGKRTARMTVAGRAPGKAAAEELQAKVRHVLRFDENLSDFYALASEDPALSWVAGGAGRMIRSASVFEEVVKTVCTTNCAWSATVRMVTALVEHLGESAAGVQEEGWKGRAFPTPEAIAGAGERFFKEEVRAGYRGPYLIAIARGVRDGDLDLEVLGSASADEIRDDEVEARLLALPGVGPYAAAHVMMMLGRYSRLILDSWTRPTYARLVGKKSVSDASIAKRFRRFGPYAGLAFWLFLTEGWVKSAKG
jgi:N-glycosylase/DNA lyase